MPVVVHCINAYLGAVAACMSLPACNILLLNVRLQRYSYGKPGVSDSLRVMALLCVSGYYIPTPHEPLLHDCCHTCIVVLRMQLALPPMPRSPSVLQLTSHHTPWHLELARHPACSWAGFNRSPTATQSPPQTEPTGDSSSACLQ
jgi:hypothetical protein